jgi:hypothetical protein
MNDDARSAHLRFEHEDEVDQRNDAMGDMLRWLWSRRVVIIGGLLLGAFLAGLVALTLRVVQNDNLTEYIIEFRFDGREENKYPNGAPFALSDIVAPGVLTAVYQAEDLGAFGLSLQQFQSSVYVSPYSPDRRLILDRYEKIDARKATVAELSEAQQGLNQELSAATRRYAVLRYTDQGFGLPQAKVSTVLERIVQEWERIAVETRGVLGVEITPLPSNVFSDESFAGLEKLNAIRIIRQNIARLREFVENVSSRPGGNTLLDPETGATTSTLKSMLDRATIQLAEIPTSWPSAPAGQRVSSLGTPINLYSDRLFDEGELANLDYLIALDLLRQRGRLIRDNVEQIQSRSFGNAARDPQTNLSARDVGRLLSDLEDYTLKQLTAPVLSLGIAKNPDVVNLYYRSRLEELQREKQTLASKAQVLEVANKNYQGLVSGVPAGAPAQPGGGGGQFPPTSATVIPQFGDAFLDRIIELSQKGGDTEFRQKLLEETVSLQQRAADTDEEIAWIKEYIDRFGGMPGQDAPARPPVDEAQRSYFIGLLDKQLPQVLTKYKEYVDITQRIAERLRVAEDIHSITMPEGEQQVGIDFYLRNGVTPSMTIEDMLKRLRDYADVANRLYGQLSAETLGRYRHLYSAASDAFLVRQPLVSRFELLVIALSAILVAMIALALSFAADKIRRRA